MNDTTRAIYVYILKQFGSGSIFCIFAFVACIFDRKGWGIRKNGKAHAKISESVCNDLKAMGFLAVA